MASLTLDQGEVVLFASGMFGHLATYDILGCSLFFFFFLGHFLAVSDIYGIW